MDGDLMGDDSYERVEAGRGVSWEGAEERVVVEGGLREL